MGREESRGGDGYHDDQHDGGRERRIVRVGI
jgi:hypothetical protein